MLRVGAGKEAGANWLPRAAHRAHRAAGICVWLLPVLVLVLVLALALAGEFRSEAPGWVPCPDVHSRKGLPRLYSGTAGTRFIRQWGLHGALRLHPGTPGPPVPSQPPQSPWRVSGASCTPAQRGGPSRPEKLPRAAGGASDPTRRAAPQLLSSPAAAPRQPFSSLPSSTSSLPVPGPVPSCPHPSRALLGAQGHPALCTPALPSATP